MEHNEYIELTRNLGIIVQQNEEKGYCRLHYESQYQDERTLTYVQSRDSTNDLTALD